jgi:hypothetical protein
MLSFQVHFSPSFDSSILEDLLFTPNRLSVEMLAPLLTLPYELREQILTYLLCQEGDIRLQYSSKPPDLFTPPVTQVCKLLREEAIGIFYEVNIFEWTIDPEAVSLLL